MNKLEKKDCCKGCENGKPGGNPACKAKLMVEAIRKAKEEKELHLKTETYEN
jgi:hypothetical protein